MRNRLMHEKMFRHEYGAVSPITKLSDVNSGGESPIIHAGKSNIGILQNETARKNAKRNQYNIDE